MNLSLEIYLLIYVASILALGLGLLYVRGVMRLIFWFHARKMDKKNKTKEERRSRGKYAIYKNAFEEEKS